MNLASTVAAYRRWLQLHAIIEVRLLWITRKHSAKHAGIEEVCIPGTSLQTKNSGNLAVEKVVGVVGNQDWSKVNNWDNRKTTTSLLG